MPDCQLGLSSTAILPRSRATSTATLSTRNRAKIDQAGHAVPLKEHVSMPDVAKARLKGRFPWRRLFEHAEDPRRYGRNEGKNCFRDGKQFGPDCRFQGSFQCRQLAAHPVAELCRAMADTGRPAR